MLPRELFPVLVFVIVLVVAVLLGNWFLAYIMQRPIEQVPNILKVITHGISLTIVIAVAKKYFVR